jgi:hypothetical protein
MDISGDDHLLPGIAPGLRLLDGHPVVDQPAAHGRPAAVVPAPWLLAPVLVAHDLATSMTNITTPISAMKRPTEDQADRHEDVPPPGARGSGTPDVRHLTQSRRVWPTRPCNRGSDGPKREQTTVGRILIGTHARHISQGMDRAAITNRGPRVRCRLAVARASFRTPRHHALGESGCAERAGLGRARGSPATRDPAFPPTRPVERRAIGTPPSGFGSGRVSFSQNGGPRRCSCRVRTPGSRSTSSGESAGTGRQPGGWCSFGYAFAAGHHTTIAPAWQVVGHSPLGIAGAFHVACNDSESLDRRTRGGR